MVRPVRGELREGLRRYVVPRGTTAGVQEVRLQVRRKMSHGRGGDVHRVDRRHGRPVRHGRGGLRQVQGHVVP